jgi:hypothetical protein
MTTTFVTHSSQLGTELAHRTGGGLEVTLYWHQATNRVTVVVDDYQAGHRLELSVDPAQASYAFNHPFAYAASQARRADPATTQPGITSDPAAVTGPILFNAAVEPGNRHDQQSPLDAQ